MNFEILCIKTLTKSGPCYKIYIYFSSFIILYGTTFLLSTFFLCKLHRPDSKSVADEHSVCDFHGVGTFGTRVTSFLKDCQCKGATHISILTLIFIMIETCSQFDKNIRLHLSSQHSKRRRRCMAPFNKIFTETAVS